MAVSYIVQFLAQQVVSGNITIDEVPDKWLADVKKEKTAIEKAKK